MQLRLAVACAVLVAVAAAQCGVNLPSGAYVDLSTVPTAALPINQMYNGEATMYTWVINLCQAVSQPPSGATACGDGPGYISEFTDTVCETAWTSITTGWQYDATLQGAKLVLVNSKAWPATVELTCGQTAELQAVGNVEVDTQLQFTFKLTTSAMCGGAPPGPGPNPPGPNPPGPNPPGPPAPPGPPSKKKSAMTGGAWFVLAFSLTIVFYVAGTVAFGFLKQGKRGKELVPHQEFWGSVPGLIKDGFIFTKDKILQCVGRLRGGGGGGGGGYQSV